MICAVYNTQTGETNYETVEDIEMPIENVVIEPTESERIKALEDTMLELLFGGTTND